MSALVLAFVLVGAGVAACSDDDGDEGEGAGGASGGGTTSTSLETGGIEVAAPDGWRAVPLPQLGFGVAIPQDWEAAVLTADTLSDLATSSPAVPGFLDAAHAAAQNGAVFYAAGADDQERVTDLKVRAIPDAGVTDLAGLDALARQLTAEAGIVDPLIVGLDAAGPPTTEIRYSTTAQRPAASDAEDAEAGGASSDTADTPTTATTEPALVDVEVRSTERLVLGPRGVVYSLIVTSEDLPGHDAVAARLLDTLAFPPA